MTAQHISTMEASVRIIRSSLPRQHVPASASISTSMSLHNPPTSLSRRRLKAQISNRPSARRTFSSAPSLKSHENPLGLPQSKPLPPNLSNRMTRSLPQKRPVPSVRHILAVSSAKGGVGKSTVAVNIALALSQLGLKTGILDTDIYGPSIPTLLNLEGNSQDEQRSYEPDLSSEGKLIPLRAYGIKAMSMGFLISGKTADARDQVIAWRGAMLQKALQQLLFDVDWTSDQRDAGLDILVLDTPPGTGDIHLTLAQTLPLSGAIVVSTPGKLALRDSVRGISMWRKTNVPVLGMVQNMSGYVCPKCGEVSRVFGEEGGVEDSVATEAKRLGLEVLADIPLDLRVRADADRGRPTVVSEPDGDRAKVFLGMARRIRDSFEL